MSEADGTRQLRFERIEVRDVNMPTRLGVVSAASAALSNVTVRLRDAPANGPLLDRIEGFTIGELRLEGARLELPLVPGRAPAGRRNDWRLEPLAALEGSVHADITDAAWVFDADVTVPIKGGRIDFNRAIVEHIGPDSSMGISRMGIYVDAPNGRTYLYLLSATHVPGATFERRGGLFARRTGDRGSIDLQPFVECFLGGVPMGALATGVRDMIARTRITADLRLGDGVMGDARDRLVLTGGAQGRNRIELSSPRPGNDVLLRVHDLSIAESRFERFGKVVSTGPLSATLSVQLKNFPAAPVAAASIVELTLRDVQCR